MPVTTNLGLAVSSDQRDYVLEYWMKMLNESNGNFVLLDNEFGVLASKLSFNIYPETWVAEDHAPFYFKSTVTLNAVVQDNSIVEAYFENILVSTGVILHSVTQNGTSLELVFYADSAKQSIVSGFVKYVYSVPGAIPLPTPSANVMSKTFTANGEYNAHAENKDGYNPITVSVAANVSPLSVSANGTYSAPEGADGYAPVVVNVPDTGLQMIEGPLPSEISRSDVTSIRDYAFYSCQTLTSVDFPNCLSIGSNAFQYCRSLTTISFPNCLNIEYYAFVQCYSLTNASFPNCLSIGGNAFYQCSSLITASFPNCLSIGNGAFQQCSSLSSISFPNCLRIVRYAFQNCYSLSEVSFPNCLNIGQQGFYNCSSLSSITILNMSTTATTLQNINTFQNTPMSDSTYLGYYGSIFVHPDRVSLYKGATNWATYSDRIVAAPSEIVNKGVWAYEYYQSTLTEIPSEKANAEIIGPSAFYSCSNLSEVNMSQVKNIGSYAFYRCSSLTNASFPNCLNVGDYAFVQCYSLTTASSPNCSIIGHGAFQECSSLSSISFPNCLIIGSYAFYICSSLSKAYFLASSIPTLSNVDVFQNTPMSNSSYLGYFGSIYVRASLLSQYQAAPNWSEYSDRLVGLTDEEIAQLDNQNS